MKKLLIALLVLAAFAPACKKRTTPRRIDRLIKGETWRLEKIVDSNVNYTLEFTNYTFDFTKEQLLAITMPDSMIVGSWDRLEEKDPAVLILNTANAGPTKKLGDDWNVIFLSKDEFRLERLNDKKHPNDECIFKRI
jgi:peroxiredoxin